MEAVGGGLRGLGELMNPAGIGLCPGAGGGGDGEGREGACSSGLMLMWEGQAGS